MTFVKGRETVQVGSMDIVLKSGITKEEAMEKPAVEVVDYAV